MNQNRKPLDPLATVQRHPEWYFRSGHFDSMEATGLLVGEALRGGAKSVTVHRDGTWISVHADVDWLNSDLAAFVSPQTYSEGGQNSSRVEVALVAFCRAVVTSTPDAPMSYWSRDNEIVVWEMGSEEDILTGRVVAFRPYEEPMSAPMPQQGVASPYRLRLVPNEGEGAIMSAVESFKRKVERIP